MSDSPICWLENVKHGTSRCHEVVTQWSHLQQSCDVASKLHLESDFIRIHDCFIYLLITSRYYSLHTCLLFRIVNRRAVSSQSYVMEKYKLLCDVLMGCHNSRHDARQIYTYIGDVCVSVNPYTNLDIYGAEYVNQYKGEECDLSPVTVWCAVRPNAGRQLNCCSNVQISQSSNK